jgi:hypothetical protein
VSDRERILAALAVPSKSLLHCGPDPGWNPEREGREVDAESGIAEMAKPGRWELQPGDTCDVCHEIVEAPDGRETVVPFDDPDDDPIEALELAVIVCAGCGRVAEPYAGRLWGRVGSKSSESSSSNPSSEIADRGDVKDATGEAVRAKVQSRSGLDLREIDRRMRQLMRGVKKP